MTAPAPFRHRPQAVNQQTGEVLTLDEVNDRIMRIADAIEESNAALTRAVEEHARVAALYGDVYDEALLASEAKSLDKREAQARQACRVARTPLGHPLAQRKAELERDIRVLRDTQHNMRSVLSAWQTASSNVKAAMGGWMGGGAA